MTKSKTDIFKRTKPLPIVELKRESFQTIIDGAPVDLYTISNAHGVVIKTTNYGAKVQQVLAPDRGGNFADVALGFDSIEGVISGQPSMGAFIGRYANRIAKSTFSLDGRICVLGTNNGANSIHGGSKGSRFRVFNASQMSASAVEFTYVFQDGEEGFPGTLSVRVIYALSDANEFSIEWFATAHDKTTVASFTNHTFFNLAGNPAAQNLNYVVTINADRYLPVDEALIPTGEIADVAGTSFDFREAKAIGRDIDRDCVQLAHGKGYDHHFVLNSPDKPLGLTFAARVEDPESGRVLEVWTTEPGLQFVTGNNLSGSIPIDAGKGGNAFLYRSAICLEPSRFPDSPNKANFPDTTLRAGECYTGKIVYKFLVAR
jgi:aldose 1-epimerase